MLIYFHHFAASVCGRCLLPLAMQVYTNPLPHCPVVAIRGRCLHEHQGGFRSLFSILHFTKGVLVCGKGGWEGDGAIYYFFRQNRLQTHRFAIRPRWQKFKFIRVHFSNKKLIFCVPKFIQVSLALSQATGSRQFCSTVSPWSNTPDFRKPYFHRRVVLRAVTCQIFPISLHLSRLR